MLSFFTSSGWAISECSGEYWDNCIATYDWSSGEKYVGEWKDDKAHGQGTENPGNSGGPIYNPEGNVVGVVMATARIREVEQEFGMLPENYNFGIKSSTLRSFIDIHDIEMKVENTSKKTNFKRGRDARAATYYIVCYMTDAKMKEIEKHREALSGN